MLKIRSGELRRLLVSGSAIAVVVAGVVATMTFRPDRLENVPAWTEHPERIHPRTDADGLMTDAFRQSVFKRTATEADLETLAEMRPEDADPVALRRVALFLIRYRDEAGRYGIEAETGERQFFWSARSFLQNTGTSWGRAPGRRLQDLVMPTYRRMTAEQAADHTGKMETTANHARTDRQAASR